jgi:hypothetical protein
MRSLMVVCYLGAVVLAIYTAVALVIGEYLVGFETVTGSILFAMGGRSTSPNRILRATDGPVLRRIVALMERYGGEWLGGVPRLPST